MTGVSQGIVVYCDGACEPTNPGGYATWAWVAVMNGQEVNRAWGCVGYGAGMSNNVAEYTAVLKALRRAKMKGVSIQINTDAQLIVKQITGAWAVRAIHLVPMCEEAQALLQETRSSIVWIPREQNARADALTRRAYHEARKAVAHGAH